MNAALEWEEEKGQGCPHPSLCSSSACIAFVDDKDGSSLLKQCHKSHLHDVFIKLGMSWVSYGVTGTFPSDSGELDVPHTSAQ